MDAFPELHIIPQEVLKQPCFLRWVSALGDLGGPQASGDHSPPNPSVLLPFFSALLKGLPTCLCRSTKSAETSGPKVYRSKAL